MCNVGRFWDGSAFRLAEEELSMETSENGSVSWCVALVNKFTRVGTLIVTTIYLQLIQNRYIAGNGLYTMLVTTLKDSETSKHVSILYQL